MQYLNVRARVPYREPEAPEFDERGLPLPPGPLRKLVSGSEESERWLRTGELDAGLIRRLVEEHNGSMTEMSAILDFGCGCGRVARWWHDLDGPRIFACDYDKRLTAWCQTHLAFLEAKTNASQPPLPYKPESFDLIYAISLFTHLREEAQDSWMLDLRRLLNPGGLLLFTVHGERFTPYLSDGEQHRFAESGLVVHSPEISGAEACAAFHPPRYVRDRLLPNAGLELVAAVYEDRSVLGLGSPMALQDNYLARKPQTTE